MRRIRILQLIPSFVVGGAERMAVQLSAALDPARFEVEVISLFGRQQTDLEGLLTQARIPVHYFNKPEGFDWKVFAKFHTALRQFRPHVVHTHLHAFNYAIPAILSRMAPRTVHTVHTVAEREKKDLFGIFPRLLFNRSVTAVAIAVAVQESIARIFGSPSVLIRNGIPLDKYAKPSKSRLHWRNQEGFAVTDVLLTSVGRFDSVKNHALLLDAFAKGPAKLAGTKLVLAGSGPLEAALRAHAERAGIQHRVKFIGVRTDVPELLNASDALVFASDSEGYPLSVMESLAAGLPVCGTAVGGIPEIVETEKEGILVPPRNADLLAGALTRICKQASDRHSMSRAAAVKAKSFDIGIMAEAYGNLYEALANGRGRWEKTYAD